MAHTLVETKQAVWQLDLGAHYNGNETTTFKVWAPHHLSLSVQVEGKKLFSMTRDENGYFTHTAQGIHPKDRYFYVLENGLMRPDPVSRSLPQGVHGPTEIVDPSEYTFNDLAWKGIDLRETIFYELHVGTFSALGTFEGVIQKLEYFKQIGVNCLEIMPIAQFPGLWNWGYDGASLYAPHSGYGGGQELKRLVDLCHQHGIAVCLDVVYNHLGPEGNYLAELGPYFSETYHTPWGKAFNYDGAFSNHVRSYVIQNALYWIVEYHVDMLRLDAIHGIYDFSATPMLLELSNEVEKLAATLGKKVHVIAETGLNDSKIIRSQKVGGLNLEGMWNDDFHHAAHVSLTGESQAYYSDFKGLSDFSKVLSEGSVYNGQYSAFRKMNHGNSFEGIPFEKFIVFLQNHDQIGNRPLGERLCSLVGKNKLKIAACMALMTPGVPLLFMGEEYGEEAPFEYFVDFEEESLMRSIFEGRKREFHREDMPFPGKESFQNSCLTWKAEAEIFKTYCDLIALRKKNLPKQNLTCDQICVYNPPEQEWVAWEYPTENNKWIGVLCNLGSEKTSLRLTLPFKHVKEKQLIYSTVPFKQRKGNEWDIPSECAFLVE